MEQKGLTEKLQWIQESLFFIVPEIALSIGLLLILFLGIVLRATGNSNQLSFDSKKATGKHLYSVCALFIFLAVLGIAFYNQVDSKGSVTLFGGMIHFDELSNFIKILFDVAALLTVLITWHNQHQQEHLSEYYVLLIAVVLGSHLLVMSHNFIMIFLSLEVVSIASYMLTGFLFDKKGAEASLKYFLFGSVASAIMLYGFSIFYGLTGMMDFSSPDFISHVVERSSPLLVVAIVMIAAGFFYKIAAAPMHTWVPDVYEAAPMPIVAFFSVVPKLAGLGILVKFLLAIDGHQHAADWQFMVGVIALVSLTVGNFSALVQKKPKRMMAYSSIAHAGFLLVGVAAFSAQGIHFMLFYACVYLLANFVIFLFLQYFDSRGIHTFADYSGVGKSYSGACVCMLVALITLTGLPPTSGFTAKLFLFTSLWEAYAQSGKPILLWLLIFGLLNTVVSLFYYLRIPYYAFLKMGDAPARQKSLTTENFLGFMLVIGILILFFLPGLLMGWINKITFVL